MLFTFYYLGCPYTIEFSKTLDIEAKENSLHIRCEKPFKFYFDKERLESDCKVLNELRNRMIIK